MVENQPDDDHRIRVTLSESKKSTTEKLAGHATVVISVCALALSVVSAIRSERHDKISVQPRLEFSTSSAKTAVEAGIYLENNGLGPAFLTGVRIYFDGRRMGSWQNVTYAAAIDHKNLFKNIELVYWNNFTTITIRSGAMVKMLYTPGSNATQDDFGIVLRERVFVIVEYRSAYGESFVECNRDKDCASHEAQLLKQGTSKTLGRR